MRRFLLWAPPVLYMAFIFYSSSQSDPMPALTQVVWDKLLHCAGYSLLALLFCRALRGEGFTTATTALVAVLLTSLYGASDEWHQKFTPLRSSDVQDWLADTTGGLLGAAAFAGAAWLMAAASDALGPQRS